MGENAEKVAAALDACVFEDVADPAAFDAGYRLLDAQFGPMGEIERRDVLDRWFAAGTLSPPDARFEARYHMLLARDRDGRVAGVRDCFTSVDRRSPHVAVLLSHSLVLPPWRRSGVAAVLRAAPAVYARRDAAALGYPQADVTLLAEMEPVDPRDRDTIVRLLAYGRAGFRVVPPTLVPYAQPDFRDVDALGVRAVPIPMMLVVRQLGDDGSAMSRERLFATLDGLRAVHAPAIAAPQLDAIRANIEQLAPREGAEIPLIRPRTVDDLVSLLRRRVLPCYPVDWRGRPAADPAEELALLDTWKEAS